MLDFIQAVTDDDVKIGDDLYEICVQRGVKKPKTAYTKFSIVCHAWNA